jgi:hypothetical protein
MRAAARSGKIRSVRIGDVDEETPTIPAPTPLAVSLTDIPPAPVLEPQLGPEGLESWNTDWRNTAAMVQHGLSLFEHFNAIFDAHRREDRKPEVEPASDPRARAQQIIAALKRHQERYEGILTALTAWHQRLERLRRFHLTSVPAAAWQGLRIAVGNALRRLHQPLNALSSIPALPESPAADDEKGLEDALNLARQDRALLEEHRNAVADFTQAVFGVRDRIARLREIIEDEDKRLSTEPASHSLTSVPSIYPVLDVRAAIPQGREEPLDTDAYGQHSSYLP